MHGDRDDELFELPAAWRAEAIAESVPPEFRPAAASGAPLLPQALEMIRRAVDHSPPGAVLDVGGGLGGLARAIAEVTARTAITVEPAGHSARSAQRLFPRQPVCRGDGARLPFATGSIAAATVVGVLSLIDVPDDLVRELAHAVRAGGGVVVIDLVSSTGVSLPSGPNQFHSIEALERVTSPWFDVVERAVGAPTVGWWSELRDAVEQAVIRRLTTDAAGNDAALQAWMDDRRHLADHIDGDDVVAAALHLRRRPAERDVPR